MFYTIYRITNTINGKTYIGKHQTDNLDDGYFGSGKYLKRAIKKYGKEKFTKEILHVLETEEEMNIKEKELVVISESSYNLCPGGQGGFGFINRFKLNRKFTYEERLRGAAKVKSLRTGIVFTEEHKRNLSMSQMGNKNCLGRKLSIETREKMRQSAIQRNRGCKL